MMLLMTQASVLDGLFALVLSLAGELPCRLGHAWMYVLTWNE